MNSLFFIVLITGIILISVSWFKNDLTCPPPHIIYRYVPASILDTQFSKENLPSNVYNDMFNNNNLLVGGVTMTLGESTDRTKNTRTSVPYMSMTIPSINDKNKGPVTGPSGL